MHLADFYREVARSEENATKFLVRHNILEEQERCVKCDGDVLSNKKTRGHDNYVWCCRRKGCQAIKSVRSENDFFTYMDVRRQINSKLGMCDILDMVCLWSIGMSNDMVLRYTGRSKSTIVDWFNYCRQVCSEIVSVNKRGQMVGTESDPIQIDESRFAGRRKYNRGCILNGDRAAIEEDPTPV